MRRHRSAIRLAVAVLAVAALAGATRAPRVQHLPFHGRLKGDVTVTPVQPPFIVDVLIEGRGRAAHLGKFTVVIPHRVDRETRTGVGTYQFKAANGDKLFADFVGQSAPTEDPTVLYIVEQATVTGGTGRFAHATGEFTVERLYDTVAGTTEGTFDGSISIRCR